MYPGIWAPNLQALIFKYRLITISSFNSRDWNDQEGLEKKKITTFAWINCDSVEILLLLVVHFFVLRETILCQTIEYFTCGWSKTTRPDRCAESTTFDLTVRSFFANSLFRSDIWSCDGSKNRKKDCSVRGCRKSCPGSSWWQENLAFATRSSSDRWAIYFSGTRDTSTRSFHS